MMRIVAVFAIFAATCEASLHTRGAQQLSKVQARAHKAVAKEDVAALAAAPAPPALPEQGFEGNAVAHVDMDTHTGDWRREYGPKGPPMHPAACHDRRAKYGDILCRDNARSATALCAIMLVVAQYL